MACQARVAAPLSSPDTFVRYLVDGLAVLIPTPSADDVMSCDPERRVPVPVAVLGELQIVAQALHPADDVTDAAPGVRPAAPELQLKPYPSGTQHCAANPITMTAQPNTNQIDGPRSDRAERSTRRSGLRGSTLLVGVPAQPLAPASSREATAATAITTTAARPTPEASR